MAIKWTQILDSNLLLRRRERTANEVLKKKKEILGQDKEQTTFKTKTLARVIVGMISVKSLVSTR